VLVTLVETKKDCLEKLFKTVKTTRWISQLARQRIPDRWTGNGKRPTAVCIESTARYNKLMSVCGKSKNQNTKYLTRSVHFRGAKDSRLQAYSWYELNGLV